MHPGALFALGIAFIAWHVLLWSIACWFVARTGGWHALAARYPARGVKERGAAAGGMLMIGEHWNGSVIVRAGDDGLAVRPAPLMAIAHPPFFLPWAIITLLPDIPSPVTRSTHVDVAGQPLSFYGAAAGVVANRARFSNRDPA